MPERRKPVCRGSWGAPPQDPHILSSTTALTVSDRGEAGMTPSSLGRRQCGDSRVSGNLPLGPAHPGIYDLAPLRKKEAEGKGGKGLGRRNRKKEGAAEAVSPLASPRGLKEALGVTVLVESMKLSEAQKIPERTLLSSFQDSSTLSGDTDPFTVPGLRLLPPSEPAAGCQATRPASCWSRNCPARPASWVSPISPFFLTPLWTPLHPQRPLLGWFLLPPGNALLTPLCSPSKRLPPPGSLPALLNHSLLLGCCSSDHPSLSPGSSWEMAGWQQHLVLSIFSPQLGCEQPEDRERVWVTHVPPTMLCKMPHTPEAEISSLIHPEVCSAGQNDKLPCQYPG